MATYQAYTVLFYLEGFNGHQLATVSSECRQTDLINYMEENSAIPVGEWHKFATQANFVLGMWKTRELGGIIYDLPVKTGE